MGVLYAKVSGQWVPIAPAGTVGPPAYAGPVASGADAIFTHLNARATNYGFNAETDGATKIHVPPSKQFNVWNRDSGNTVFYPTLQVVSDKVYAGRFWFGSFPPAASYAGMWRDGVTALEQYTLLSSAGETLVNVPATGAVRLRVNNADRLQVIDNGATIWGSGTSGLLLYGRQTTYYTCPDGWWDKSQLLLQAPSGWAKMSFNLPGLAYHLQLHGSYAGVGVSNSDASAHSSIKATSFDVASSTTIKRDVRPLRSDREHIAVHHEPLTDTVPDPDIMSLRPVAFRPKVGHIRDDGEPEGDTVFGIQGRRERLGLIAEEVQHVIPSAVTHDPEGNPGSVDYAQITVALLDHVQQLTDLVHTLQYRITELENR